VTRASWSVGRIFGLTIALILSLGLITALGAPPQSQPASAPEEIGTVRQLFDGVLYPEVLVNTLRNMDRLCPTRIVKHGNSVYPLPKSDTPLKGIEFTSGGKKYDLYDYMSLDRVSGLLILKDGKIALERYDLGNTEKSRWYSASLIKSISSTLVAAAIKDGYIKSLDDPITQYLPELTGSAYEGVTVKNLLQMASGVKWDETYTNPASDRRRMLDAQLAGNHANYEGSSSCRTAGNYLELQHWGNANCLRIDSCSGQKTRVAVPIRTNMGKIRHGI
jgi:hypothetical protein